MARAVFILLSVAAALVAAQQPAAQQALSPAAPATAPETRKPIMVDSLQSVVAPAAPPAANPPAVPAPAHAVSVPTGFETELGKLQASIEAQKQTVDALSKQLEDGLKAKNRLLVAQKLMVAIISLKKAERVLGEVDAKIEAAKANIKKFGDQADEITEGIKRSEVEHKKELTDLNKKLDTLRSGLADQQKVLEDLAIKRARISNTVQRWKEHVSTLRDAHEAAAQPEGTVAQPAADPLDVPEPPSTMNALGEIGVFSHHAHAPAANLNEVVASSNYDAAVRELAKRTFAELGQGRFAESKSLRGMTEEDGDEDN